MDDSSSSKKLINTIIAIGAFGFSGIVIETAVNIAFPTLMQTYQISSAVIQWLTTAYMIVSTALIPLAPYLKLNFTNQQLFKFSFYVFSLGLIIDGLALNFWMLLFGRIIQGVATGITLPLMFSIILEQTPKAKLGTMMGLGTLVIAFAPAIGPSIGGIIISLFGWRYIFFSIFLVIVPAFILGIHNIEQIKPIEKTKFDLIGTTTLSILVVLTIYLLTTISTGGSLYQTLCMIAVLVIDLIIFILYEIKQSVPLLDLDLFINKDFLLGLIPFFLLQVISLSLSYLIPNVFQVYFKATPMAAGLLVLPAAVMDALIAPCGGVLLDKFGERKPIFIGTFLVMIASLILTITSGTRLSISLLYVLFMIGLGLSYGNIMTSSLGNLSGHTRDSGNSIFNTMQQFAGATGVAISAAIVSKYQQSGQGVYALATLRGTKTAFGLALGFSILVIVLLSWKYLKLKTVDIEETEVN